MFKEKSHPGIKTLGKSATILMKYITLFNTKINQGGVRLSLSATYTSRDIQSSFSPVEITVGSGEE